jgi:iron complex transport system ATP-binding protein
VDKVTYDIRGLSFGYSDTCILNDLDLTFEPGTLTAIVGPNGSGKSTLLDLMSGHHAPTAGTVHICGKPVSSYNPVELARLTALVPQEFDFNFPFTVREAVLMGRHPHIPRFSHPSAHDMALVDMAMKMTDIAFLGDRILAELSGGEKQRTIFARALAQDTPALLLDEPTSSMDICHALKSMTELKKLTREKERTVVTILHDLNLAAGFCDRIVMLKHGRIHAWGNAAETITAKTISNVFGVHAEVINTATGLHISYGIKEQP